MASSATETLSPARVRALVASGFGALEERKQEINDLNVYPVPDGDTGTNLALTVKSIVEGLAHLPEGADPAEVCSAVSQSALMGARGNSGVILSQIVRGAMEALAEETVIDARALAGAFTHATETAYRAVRRPVEGTMLTVLKDMAEAGEEAESAAEVAPFIEHVVDAGWKSVERTPTLLKVLADAGVVDAGGFGLVVLIEGAARGGEVWEPPVATRVTPVDADVPEPYVEMEDEGESAYLYCTSFLISGDDLDKESLERRMGDLGDSLLVVGDRGRLKIHIHTDDPGPVLAMGTAMGVLSGIQIDNMHEQAAARNRRLGDSGDAVGDAAEADRVEATPADAPSVQVIAVVSGEGNKGLFRSLGVDLIVDGGQSMNPSAQDLMTAIQEAEAPSVIILPNNSNIVMTAEQTAALAEGDIRVVPTRSIQAGLSAAVALDGRASAEENVIAMTAAIEGVVAGEITRAVRECSVDGVEVAADDFIGLVEGRVVVSAVDLQTVVDDVVQRLLGTGKDMLTGLVGEGEDGVQATIALEAAVRAHPAVEIEVHQGGQPFYALLLSAE